MYQHRLMRWDEAEIDGWERIAPTVEDDPQARIGLLGPDFLPGGLREIIPSWEAETPPATWIEVQLQVRFAGHWGAPLRMGIWDSADAGTRRSSVVAQPDGDLRVATDTLVLGSDPEAVRIRVLFCAEPGADMPELRSLSLCLSTAIDRPTLPTPPAPHIPPISLPVLRSQYAYADGAGWCSPTALSMVLAYWYRQTGDARLAPFSDDACLPDRVAPMVHDRAWGGTGNWSFNVAYAATLGLTAYVTRLQDLAQAARWIAAGVPLIYSIAWDAGELDHAPVEDSGGHLALLLGVGPDEVVVADPAGPPQAVLRRYSARQVAELWQRRSSGTIYLIHPPEWPRPAPGPEDAWA
jgi:hypothetical protein